MDWMNVIWVAIALLVVLPVLYRAWMTAKVVPLTKDQLDDLKCMQLIHDLRNVEGWAVELICDNPDFIGPSCIVDVFGEWHDVAKDAWAWEDKRFEGTSLFDCLQQAKAERDLQYSVHKQVMDRPMCGRCYDSGQVFPANCAHKPETLVNTPIGMHHCPDCGAMVVAGLPHPGLCARCIRREHPAYDRPASAT